MIINKKTIMRIKKKKNDTDNKNKNEQNIENKNIYKTEKIIKI